MVRLPASGHRGPIEVLAAIQYMSSASWASGWYNPSRAPSRERASRGRGLMVVFVIINLIGVVGWPTSTRVTTWKVAIPVLTVIVFCLFHFHAHNFTAGGGFFIPGHDGGVHAILEAIAAGGIVFALLGFEQAVQLGGKVGTPAGPAPIGDRLDPHRSGDLHLAQFAFIGALNRPTIATTHVDQPGDGRWVGTAPFYTVGQGRGNRLAGLDPAHRRRDLAAGPVDLPHVGLSDRLRPLQKRLRPRSVREEQSENEDPGVWCHHHGSHWPAFPAPVPELAALVPL